MKDTLEPVQCVDGTRTQRDGLFYSNIPILPCPFGSRNVYHSRELIVDDKVGVKCRPREPPSSILDYLKEGVGQMSLGGVSPECTRVDLLPPRSSNVHLRRVESYPRVSESPLLSSRTLVLYPWIDPSVFDVQRLPYGRSSSLCTVVALGHRTLPKNLRRSGRKPQSCRKIPDLPLPTKSPNPCCVRFKQNLCTMSLFPRNRCRSSVPRRNPGRRDPTSPLSGSLGSNKGHKKNRHPYQDSRSVSNGINWE